MKRLFCAFIGLSLCLNFTTATAQHTSSESGGASLLLPRQVVAALAQELSGETAKRNLEFLARQHRMRGSRGFRAAAEHVAEQLRAYGLADVRIEQFPADGKTFYGTQRSRPAWDAEFAELWELRAARAARGRPRAARELGRDADHARAGQRERRT